MLWTLLKFAIFFCLVAAATWGAGLLMEADGGLQVRLPGQEFTLGAFESVLAVLAVVLACYVVFKLVSLFVAFVRFLLGDETAISRFFDRRRERKGYDALSEGMMALASGESKLALTKAAKADRLLSRPDLTTLLTAQAAEQAGDAKAATEAYRQLLEDDRTRFVGVRGLMKQKLNDGETETALKLAEKAFALKPKHLETQDTLLELQAGASDWAGARKTLGAKVKYGSLPRDLHKRRDAVLAIGEAREIPGDDSAEKREKAIEANKLSSDLIPAAVMAADAFIADGKPKNAMRLLKKAWSAQPHPELAAAFARIAPEETPKERIKRFAGLIGLRKDDAETKMLEAELHIAAEDFPSARKALGDLAESDPTPRSLAIMAAIEKGSGADDAVVKGWLARAITAPRGPQWACDKCQTAHANWEPVCNKCNSFDTLSWRTVEHQSAALPSGAEMLPLIVGQIAPPSDETPEGPDGGDKAPIATAGDDAIEVGSNVDDVTIPDAEGEDSTKPIANADSPPADFAPETDTFEIAKKS